jgi:negative regulator of sigma-B (phosphoserine phosphatase)
MMMKPLKNAELQWGVATRALPGETECGDRHVVARTDDGWLLAVADGLGHGPEAAVAGTIFYEVLHRHLNENPVKLIHLCHEALKGTRGIACTILTIDRQKSLLSWIGIGNVEGVVRHFDPIASPTDYVTMRGGIVGYRIPEVQLSYLQLLDGDILALATDGIAVDFVSALSPVHPPEVLADRILQQYAKPIDDALILIAHWPVGPARQERSAS